MTLTPTSLELPRHLEQATADMLNCKLSGMSFTDSHIDTFMQYQATYPVGTYYDHPNGNCLVTKIAAHIYQAV